MALSTKHRRAIERLKSYRRSWPKLRWFCLAVGAALIAYSVAAPIWIKERLIENASGMDGPFEGVLDLPFCMVYARLSATTAVSLMVGVGVCAWVIATWKGNPRSDLLLALAEELEATSEQGK